MKCKNCGAQNNENSKFCEVCGNLLKEIPDPEPSPKKTPLLKIIMAVVVVILVVVGIQYMSKGIGNHKEVVMDETRTVATTSQTMEQTVTETTQAVTETTAMVPAVKNYTGWKKNDAIKDLQSQGYSVAIDTKEYYMSSERIGTVVSQNIDIDKKTATLGINKDAFNDSKIKKSKAVIKTNVKEITLKVGEKKNIFCQLSGKLPKQYSIYYEESENLEIKREWDDWVDYNSKNVALKLNGESVSKGYIRFYLKDENKDKYIAYCDVYVTVELEIYENEEQKIGDYTGWSKQKAVKDLKSKGWKVAIDKFKYKSCREKIGTVVYQDVNTNKKTVTLGISQSGFDYKVVNSKAVIKANKKKLTMKVGETVKVTFKLSGSLPNRYTIYPYKYPNVKSKWGNWNGNNTSIKLTGKSASKGYIRFYIENEKTKKFIAYEDIYLTVKK